MRHKPVSDYIGIKKEKKRDLVFAVFCIGCCLILFFLPTDFKRAAPENSVSCKSEVIEADNSSNHVIGLIRTGEQKLRLKILAGKYKGMIVDTVNHFLGKPDLDKFFQKGDKVYTVLEIADGKITYATAIDRYRLDLELTLITVFIVFLLLFSGWTGLKAVLSFFLTALIIWKLLLPGYLKNVPVLPLAMLLTSVMTGFIIFLVAGLNRKGLSAFLGALSGILFTCFLSIIFSEAFHIPGEILPYAETLLYTGYSTLNLSAIFTAGIFIAASGAVMDIAMDIAASLSEIVCKKPEIGIGELIFSGFTISRSVIGTMITTLLLAYSGGYATLLMVFIAQGVPPANLFNYQIIAGEILHTITGSFGLVFTAPLTVICSALILKSKKTMDRK